MSLPVGTPSIITIADLSKRLGISRTTLWKWIVADPKWRGCIAKSSRKKIWLSVQRLIDNGIIPRPEGARVVPIAGPSFSYEVKAS